MNTTNLLKKVLLYSIVFVSSISLFSQTTHRITDPETLTSLSETLQAGDIVILADGMYTSDERIKFSPTTGTASSPITFRSETPGGVKFTGGLKMSIGGDYVIVDGFYWKGGFGASNFIEFRDGSTYANHSIIQNCAIDGLGLSQDDINDDLADNSITKHRWIVLYGTYNTVINCSFMNKKSAGALVLVELEYNASPDDGITNTRCDIVGHTISHNYFYKYEKINSSLSNAGDSETIRVGTSEYQNVNSSTKVSNNYFVEADGENEIITNKSKNNTYSNNTFRRCRGSLVLRHGSNATVNGNYFLGENVDGTGGLRISDSDHVITNNYIQDCITVLSQAKWNNGITFMGGGDSDAVICTSTSVSNGYQKSRNITISNNSIVNTNAPLFYNTNKGKTDPLGLISNNLIYFSTSNQNSSDIISGDNSSAYSNIGTKLTYSGNVYKGANLGATNSGFTNETAIIATSDNEIFTFSGNGTSGKGANMGSYKPTTDNSVGYGIGACFLDNLGNTITNGTCTVKLGESLSISNLPTLDATSGNYEVTVNSNVDWTASSNDTWISIDTSSGSGNQTVSIAVTQNTSTTSRTGSITFTYNSDGEDVVRNLTIIQAKSDPTTGLMLINTGIAGNPVTVTASTEQNPNIATNTLDKDIDTRWSGEGIGTEIIFDLGSLYDLDLIRILTTSGKTYYYEILTSTNGSNYTSVSNIESNTTGTFESYQVTNKAQFVKIIGGGQINGSLWNTIKEIEFYGESILSTEDNELKNSISIYPNPVKNTIHLEKENHKITSISIYTLEGVKITDRVITDTETEINIDVSSLSNGTYLLFINGQQIQQSELIIISN